MKTLIDEIHEWASEQLGAVLNPDEVSIISNHIRSLESELTASKAQEAELRRSVEYERVEVHRRNEKILEARKELSALKRPVTGEEEFKAAVKQYKSACYAPEPSEQIKAFDALLLIHRAALLELAQLKELLRPPMPNTLTIDMRLCQADDKPLSMRKLITLEQLDSGLDHVFLAMIVKDMWARLDAAREGK